MLNFRLHNWCCICNTYWCFHHMPDLVHGHILYEPLHITLGQKLIPSRKTTHQRIFRSWTKYMCHPRKLKHFTQLPYFILFYKLPHLPSSACQFTRVRWGLCSENFAPDSESLDHTLKEALYQQHLGRPGSLRCQAWPRRFQVAEGLPESWGSSQGRTWVCRLKDPHATGWSDRVSCKHRRCWERRLSRCPAQGQHGPAQNTCQHQKKDNPNTDIYHIKKRNLWRLANSKLHLPLQRILQRIFPVSHTSGKKNETDNNNSNNNNWNLFQ